MQSKNGSINDGCNGGSVKEPRVVDGSAMGEAVTQVVSALQPMIISVITAAITASTKQVMADLMGGLLVKDKGDSNVWQHSEWCSFKYSNWIVTSSIRGKTTSGCLVSLKFQLKMQTS